MSLGISACFYLLIGIAVAVALWLGRSNGSVMPEVFQILSAPFFWPIYLPVLLSRQSSQITSEDPTTDSFSAQLSTDEMTVAISQVELELDAALHSLDGWAGNVLADERHRITELKNAWRQQATHIRELDRLLERTSDETSADATVVSAEAVASSTCTESLSQPATGAETSIADLPDATPTSRILQHERSRSENIARLLQLRQMMFGDLMATVAWVRDLVTMIHLAKYSGAPATRAQELVRQIAAAVECLSDIH